MGFLTSLVKNGEIRPSLCYKIILERREERNQLNSGQEQLVLCSSAFWKQEYENFKNISLTFFQVSIHSDLLCLWPEALIDSFIAMG